MDSAEQQQGGSRAELSVPRLGMAVRLAQRLPYLKTAEPMPMLRPPDLVSMDEQGQVVALRAQGLLAVRFRRGTFLIPADAVRPC